MELNGYEIFEEIGSGGGGVVYRAYHRNLRKQVIIKKIHDTITDEAMQRAEVDILKNLHHPYLPQVFDYFVVNGVGYTVMDFVEGESLQQMLDRGIRFSENQVLKYANQLAEALEYLHAQNPPIIHGDIKPDNIMRTPEDNICLIDFNISGISTDGRAETFGYTPGYSAPEQYAAFMQIRSQMQSQQKSAQMQGGAPAGRTGAGETELLLPQNAKGETEILSPQEGTDRTELLTPQEKTDRTEILMPQTGADGTEILMPHQAASADPRPAQNSPRASMPQKGIPIDKRSDVYSFGATLYHLYTGKRIDQDGSRELNTHTSEGLLYVLNTALQQDPAKRFQSGSELHRALRNLHKRNRVYRRMVMLQTMIKLILVGLMLFGAGLILTGRDKLREEKEQEYKDYIRELEEYRLDGSESRFADIYERAVAFAPDRLEPYYQQALFLYETRQYDEGISYIREEILPRGEMYEQDRIGQVYMILGNCYYETEDYEQASRAFANAIYYDDSNAEVYVDQAISLARNGEVQRAQDALERAIRREATDDHVFLARGEIANANQDYETAKEYLKQCIDITEDDYVRMRAGMSYARAADAQRPALSSVDEDEDLIGEAEILTEDVIELLNGVIGSLSSEYQLIPMQQLAIEYIYLYDHMSREDCAYAAIDVLSQIEEKGWADYTVYDNMVNLYHRLHELEKEEELLDRMSEIYTDNYRIMIKYALLEFEKQKDMAGDDRDFSAFLEYYHSALDLYEEAGESSRNEQEIALLRQAYDTLVENNWIEE